MGEAEEAVQRLAEPLGQIIIEFNFLEVQLSFLLASLASEGTTRPAGRLSFSKKLKLVEQISRRSSDPKLVRETLDVTDALRELNLQRNMYIHSEYFAEYNDVNDFLGVRHREIKDFDKQLFSEGVLRAIARDDLDAFISRLRSVAERLAGILVKISPSSVRFDYH